MSTARRSGWSRPEVRRGDWLVAFVVGVPVAGSVISDAVHTGRPLVAVLVLGAAAAIFLRREQSLAAVALAVAVAIASPDNRALVLPVMVVLYTIATRAPWRVAAGYGGAGAAAMILAGVAWGGSGLSGRGGVVGYAIGIIGTCGAAVALGLYVGARRRVLEGLHQHAERLERERELLAERAVARERVRIAQELHDIVAHNVSLMVVKAQALGVTVDDPAVAESTDAIAELGRQAMHEMHTTLRLLRGDEPGAPELAPQPGLAQLDRLVEQSRGAGLEIEFVVHGQPRALAQAVDLSAFRIVQEALTNIVKHAAGAHTRVSLDYRSEDLTLTILDTLEHPNTAGVAANGSSEGHGVIGMRERAALFGGTLNTEALPDGFRVTATLPYEPAAS